MASKAITASLVDDRGTWTVKGRVYDPLTGRMRQRTKSTGFKVKDSTKRKAEAMKQAIVAEWQAELDGEKKTVSPQFSVYVQKFLDRKTALRKKGNTIKSYQDYYVAHIGPKLGSIPIQEMTLQDIEGFYKEYLKTHTVNSARKVNCVVSGAFREAIRDGEITVNLADSDHLEFPKAEKFDGGGYYVEKEVATLFAAAKKEGEPIRAAVILAVCYGLRRSEICGLRWKDIDFENETLTVSNTVVANGSLSIEAEDTKTNSGHRFLFLCKDTIPYFEELKKAQESTGKPLDKVCSWPDGRNVRPDFITYRFKRLVENSGLCRIRFHDLRHTAATLLAPNVSDQQLKGFLGHRDKSVTYGIYAHLMDKERKETAEIMNDILKNAGVLF